MYVGIAAFLLLVSTKRKSRLLICDVHEDLVEGQRQELWLGCRGYVF